MSRQAPLPLKALQACQPSSCTTKVFSWNKVGILSIVVAGCSLCAHGHLDLLRGCMPKGNAEPFGSNSRKETSYRNFLYEPAELRAET